MQLPVLQKCPTGIAGFDELTLGGLPRHRTSLVCGGAGCGKTLFGMQFLINGITEYGENGVLLAFEETPEELAENVASLGIDLAGLCGDKRLTIDHFRIERSEIIQAGDYSLDGLFLRLELAIQAVGAKRVVIDTLEALFSGLGDTAILRAELRRLFRWLNEQNVTAVVTAERGDGTLTRHGLEEYVSDCVILLDHRVVDQITTRRVRVVKYRGSTHGTNEYPFLIDEQGLSVIPITSFGLRHGVSEERVSTGIAGLDQMLSGAGYFRGSTVLISGTAGAGKTGVAAHFADAICRAGERCLFFSFEESPDQVERNMRSIGLDLHAHHASGRLMFQSTRPTTYGLETHLVMMHKGVAELAPSAVVIDPVSNLVGAATADEAHLMLVRLIDFLKSKGITAVLTSLSRGGETIERTDVNVSSIVDTWILLKHIEHDGERNRGLYVLKSRGMSHSNQIREFFITDHGIELLDVCVGPGGVLTGSARRQYERGLHAEQARRQRDRERRRRELECRRRVAESKIAALRAQLEADELELQQVLNEVDHPDAERVQPAAQRSPPQNGNDDGQRRCAKTS